MVRKSVIIGVFSLVMILLVSMLAGSYSFKLIAPASSIEANGDSRNIGIFQSPVRSFAISNTTWSIIDSPVHITGNLTVGAGQILNITSGVTVIFQGNYSISVEGHLNCSGNFSSPVTITGDRSLNNCSGAGIELAPAGTLLVDRSNIENLTGFVWRGSICLG